MTTKQLKVAVYTRKSTEHGLDQEFNSLEAQREAAEAYIKSQRSEGWVLVNDNYDDGGISGGTLERPALLRLLKDVEASRVDIIVVYKVDRLTRSLSDFARIIELLDNAGASFVSVTQQFNTSNSMGRLTLNVLLSFAQFEREVTAERIRDKVKASRRKGMWMGGTVPLGYDNIDKKLIINEREAETVKEIFECYLESDSISKTCFKLNTLGHRTKVRRGVKEGGQKFCPGHINAILKNPLYIGQVRHKEKVFEGEHAAIIDRKIWDKAQQKINENKITRLSGKNTKAPGLLCGILKTDNGEKLYPTHCNKQDVRYHYYITKPVNPDILSLRYSAPQIDDAVRNNLILWLIDKTRHDLHETYDVIRERNILAKKIKKGTLHQHKLIMKSLLKEVIIYEHKIRLFINKIGIKGDNYQDCDTAMDEDTEILDIDIKISHGRKNKKLIIPTQTQVIQKPDQKLITLIAKAHLWAKELQSGKYKTMTELAEKCGINKSDLAKQIRLVYLAPDIITAIMEGRQPSTLNATILRKLNNLPACWLEQRKVIGFL